MVATDLAYFVIATKPTQVHLFTSILTNEYPNYVYYPLRIG